MLSAIRFPRRAHLLGYAFLVLSLCFNPMTISAETHLRVSAETADLRLNRSRSLHDEWIFNEMFDALLALDSNWEIKPNAATHWSIEEAGKVFRFHLDPAGQWSDGTPLVANDFIQALRVALSKPQGHSLHFLLDSLLIDNQPTEDGLPAIRAEQISEHEFTLRFDTAGEVDLSVFATSLGYPRPVHVLPNHDMVWKDLPQPPSNGPMVLASYDAESIDLIRNDNYNRQGSAPTQWDKLSFIIQSNRSSFIEDYLNNDIDIVRAVLSRQRQWAKTQVTPEEIILTPVYSTLYMSFDTRSGPLADKHNRRIVAKSLNQNAIDRIISLGRTNEDLPMTEPYYGFVPSGFMGFHSLYNADTMTPLDDAPIEPFSITITSFKQENSELIANRLKLDLANKGIEVITNQLSYSFNEYAAALQSGESDILIFAWYPDYPSPRSFLDIFASNTHWGSYLDDAKYRAMLSKASQTSDPDERMRLYQEAEFYLLDDLAATRPLTTQTEYRMTLVKPHIGGADRILTNSDNMLLRWSETYPKSQVDDLSKR